MKMIDVCLQNANSNQEEASNNNGMTSLKILEYIHSQTTEPLMKKQTHWSQQKQDSVILMGKTQYWNIYNFLPIPASSERTSVYLPEEGGPIYLLYYNFIPQVSAD